MTRDDTEHDKYDETFEGDLPPLDADEQQWVALLSQPDREVRADGKSFVAVVMDRLDRERGPAVLARLGGWRPVAAAAAIVLAACVGWVVMQGQTSDDTSGHDMVDNDVPADATPTDVPPPDDRPAVATETPKPSDVEVGRIIADASRSLTAPQFTVMNTDQAPTRLQRVLQLFENPVDDAERFLPERAGNDRG